jgi:hypothetical protein
MAGTSKYFYGHFEPQEWTSRNELMAVCVTGLMGQTTVAEPECVEFERQKLKPDYAAAGPVAPYMDTIMRVSH